MRESETTEVWGKKKEEEKKNLQDNLFRVLGRKKKVLRLELIVFFW